MAVDVVRDPFKVGSKYSYPLTGVASPFAMGHILNFKDYTVAWIAVLPVEADAYLGMLDNQHYSNLRQFEAMTTYILKGISTDTMS